MESNITVKRCGKAAWPLVPRLGLAFACVLPVGHEEDCKPGGNCFKHGEYIGAKCPEWPNCIQILPVAPSSVAPESGDPSTYLSPKGTLFSFSGWRPGESPIECFDQKDWIACIHGTMLALTLIDDPSRSHKAISDDGILHELIHLLAGIDISTHSTVANLRDDIFLVQRLAVAKIADR